MPCSNGPTSFACRPLGDVGAASSVYIGMHTVALDNRRRSLVLSSVPNKINCVLYGPCLCMQAEALRLHPQNSYFPKVLITSPCSSCWAKYLVVQGLVAP